jgi:putative sugar O-methyltransferase
LVPTLALVFQRLHLRLSRLALSREDDLIDQAASLAHAARFEEALAALDQAASINPGNPRLDPHLGRIRYLISRSLAPNVPAETSAMLASMAAMDQQLKTNPLYVPSEFWSSHGKFHIALLTTYGIENFKRTVSHNYQNWLMTSWDDPQVQRLLQTWADQPRVEPFVNAIETPDHVGYHPRQDFVRPEYPLASRNEREVYRLAVGLLWERVLHTDTYGILATLEELEVGNPVRIWRHGRPISSDLAHSVRERNLLFQNLGLHGREGLVVGELGAGHGRLAEIFGRTTNYRYFVFDIAPALYVSQWYVKRIFPTERIFEFRHFDDWREVRDEVASCRFAFFTANQIELLPDRLFDLFINMNSLMEMRREQIKNFLKHIDRLCTRAFLSRQWLRWRNDFDGITVGKDDYVLAERWSKSLDCTDDIHPDFFNQIWERRTERSV